MAGFRVLAYTRRSGAGSGSTSEPRTSESGGYRLSAGVPSAALAGAGGLFLREFLEPDHVHLGRAVQGHRAGLQNHVVQRAHIRRQGTRVLAKRGFGEVRAGALLDKRNDALAPST